eukprot:4551294-Alexandrium_andersonii.AAC.1
MGRPQHRQEYLPVADPFRARFPPEQRAVAAGGTRLLHPVHTLPASLQHSRESSAEPFCASGPMAPGAAFSLMPCSSFPALERQSE